MNLNSFKYFCGRDKNMWSHIFFSYLVIFSHFYLMSYMPFTYQNLINFSLHKAFDHNININNYLSHMLLLTDWLPLTSWRHLTLVCHDLKERLIRVWLINRKKAGQTRSVPMARWHLYEAFAFLKQAKCFHAPVCWAPKTHQLLFRQY